MGDCWAIFSWCAEINEGPTEEESFMVSELEKYLREMDAPLEHFMTP